jgi:hypothetical protein
MSDVGFMAMDLQSHGLTRLANRFVNACIERSGDHAGLGVLRYYRVHRALVRAKVAALRGVQLHESHAAPGGSPPLAESGKASHDLRHYLAVALDCSRHAPPVLMLTHGFSGSGKTVLTQSLLELCGAIRIRADVERKRLFGLPPLAHSDAGLKERLYSRQANEATQARLREAAAHALAAGCSVILDATFLDFEDRRQARALADRWGVRCVVIDFLASAEVLRDRVAARAKHGDDASEADLAVLERQCAHAQPLRPEEMADVFAFNAELPLDETGMAQRWAPLLEWLGMREAST